MRRSFDIGFPLRGARAILQPYSLCEIADSALFEAIWIWGTRAHADSFTLQIGAAPVPEPSSLMLLALSLGYLLLLGARHRSC